MNQEIEQPMGNTELRLSLSNLEEEVADAKGIALDTLEQAKKTNGHVADAFREIEDLKRSRTGLYYALVALTTVMIPILSASLYREWNPVPTISPAELQTALYAAVHQEAENEN